MNYRHVYMLIIEHAKSEMSNGLRPKNQLDKKNFNDYFELHHVLPKSKFPNWGKRQLNIVALTLREHYFCHLLLTKIYNDRCIQLAYLLMANRLKSLGLKVCSRSYEQILLNHPNKGRMYFNNGEKTVFAFERPTGFVDGDLNKRASGYKWYNNGTEQALFKPDKQPIGWIPGMCKMEHSEKSLKSCLGKHWYNNGIEQRQFFEKPDGWSCGRIDKGRSKKIICVELNKVFNNAVEASKYFNFKCPSNLTKAANNGKLSHGYHWRYVD